MSAAGRLERLAELLETPIEWIGRAVSWLVLAVVGLTFAIVIARYFFNIGFVAWQEAVLWLHSAVFLLGAAFALKRNAHVRIDVLSQRFSARGRALTELAATLVFLLPFAGFMLWVSLDYVEQSWRIGESSREPSGLPAIWLFKALIPGAAILLLVQGLAIAARQTALLIDGADATATSPDEPNGGYTP